MQCQSDQAIRLHSTHQYKLGCQQQSWWVTTLDQLCETFLLLILKVLPKCIWFGYFYPRNGVLWQLQLHRMYFGRFKMKTKTPSGCRAEGRVKSWVFQAVLSAFLFPLLSVLPDLPIQATATCLAAFLLKEALLPILLARVFTQVHSELVGEADPAEKLVKLCFFTGLFFS